jgi:hypothetical protein
MKRLKLLLPLLLAVMAFSQFSVADSHKKHEMKMAMTHVTILHEVDDADHWFAAWRGENSRHKMFKAHGAKHVHTLQDPNNPNMTGLIVAVADMDQFKTFLESEEGQAAAAEDGVKMDTMVMLVEAK